MALAAEIAAPESEMGDAFHKANRIPELIQLMAWSSKRLLAADDQRSGKSRGGKRNDEGTLALWSLKVPKSQ